MIVIIMPLVLAQDTRCRLVFISILIFEASLVKRHADRHLAPVDTYPIGGDESASPWTGPYQRISSSP